MVFTTTRHLLRINREERTGGRRGCRFCAMSILSQLRRVGFSNSASAQPTEAVYTRAIWFSNEITHSSQQTIQVHGDLGHAKRYVAFLCETEPAER